MNTELIYAQTELTTKPMSTRWQQAMQDIWVSIISWRIWLMLSWQDIKLRYRRSSLGPFWLTLSMAITIYTMGFLYGHLFRVELHTYYPFLAAGMLAWTLMSTLIIEGTNTFVEAENYLKQMKLPFTIFIFRVVTRSLIIFFHNVVVIIPILIIFKIQIGWSILMLIPGLAIIATAGVCFGMTLALLGGRYRDIAQIVVSLMQVAFFLTPIMWSPQILPERYQFIVLLNPFAQFVELLRAPLTGSMPSAFALIYTLLVCAIGLITAISMFVKVRHRIIYWL